MQQRHPYREHVQVYAGGGTYDYLRSQPVPEGQILVVTNLAYENETGARGTFRRYIDGHGYNHYLAEHASPGSGELIYDDTELYLLPREQLVIRQASCTAADVLQLYITGYILFTIEPVVEV
jgi:hypothetical protein